jgi:hypothetical protein
LPAITSPAILPHSEFRIPQSELRIPQSIEYYGLFIDSLVAAEPGA